MLRVESFKNSAKTVRIGKNSYFPFACLPRMFVSGLTPSSNIHLIHLHAAMKVLLSLVCLCLGALVFSSCATGQRPQYGCGAAAEDGRFTIGTGSKRLMYGYPSPHSTSHFVLSVNGKFASNNPCLRTEAGPLTYLYGTQRKWGEGGSLFSSIEYDFEGVTLTQRLVPVDKTFRDVEPGQFGQYYRIEYTMENNTSQTLSAGLTLLIDTMIDTNDGAAMEADGTKVTTETKFSADKVPSEILVYKSAGNKSDLVASVVTDKGKFIKPDELCVGRWRYLYPTIWDINANGEQYGDSGIMFKWNEQAIEPRIARFVATHYGLPTFANGEIQMKSFDPKVQRQSAQVFFEFGDDKLSDTAKAAITELVSGKGVEGIFVEVHTDAVGKDANNIKLAQRRGESIMKHLESLHLSREIMIVKPFGAQFADKSFAAVKGGKLEDRRADVSIYVKVATN